MSTRSEHGRLEFLSYAARARTRGRSGGALLFWLLREKATAFITQSDEDDAAGRLREHRNQGPSWITLEETPPPEPEPTPFTDQDRFIAAVLRVAQQQRIDDPYHVARRLRPMTREEWDAAHLGFQQGQLERWQSTDMCEAIRF